MKMGPIGDFLEQFIEYGRLYLLNFQTAAKPSLALTARWLAVVLAAGFGFAGAPVALDLGRCRVILEGLGIKAESPSMNEVFEKVRRLAPTKLTVVIQGETGVGKEKVAQALHALSGRGVLVSENMALVDGELQDSMLFGHVKGAFTGAHQSAKGLFAQAEGGTLFLDEVGELSLKAQAKLLRALEEKAIRPLGSENKIPVDVRLVVATNRDLAQMVREGKFREDLYHRLKQSRIHVPSLRERPEDIIPLAYFFINNFIKENDQLGHPAMTREAESYLRERSWAGNVRELKSFLEGFLVERDWPTAIDVEDFRSYDQNWDALRSGTDISAALANIFEDSIDPVLSALARHVVENPNLGSKEMEDQLVKKLIQLALEKSRCNKTRAADSLGLNRTTLIERMNKYGIHCTDPVD